MTEREFLERLDQHIVVANEHMGQSKEHMARGNELMQEMRDLHADTRRFMRDLTRRNEIVMGELVEECRAGQQVLNDLHGESVAQRQAILTLIDELREHGLGGRG